MPIFLQDIDDFSGGLNSRDADHKIQPNESAELVNYEINADGSLDKRAGSSKYNASTIEADAPVHSLFRFYKSATAFKKMVAGVDDGLWLGDDGAGTWSEIGTDSLSTSDPVSFAILGDVLYLFNGTVKLQYDGTTLGAIPNSPPDGKYVVFHKDRLFVAGDPANPNRLYFSDQFVAGGAITWNTGTNKIDIRSNDGDEIRGILPISDFLVIYKRNGIWVLFGDSNDNWVLRQRVENIGLMAPKSLVGDNNLHYFLDRKGVYVYNGASAEKISGKVDPEITAIPTASIENSASVVYKERYWMAYTPAGETENKRILVFDLRSGFNGWTIFKAINVRSFTLWNSRDDVGEIYAGDSGDGFVWRLDTGTDDGGTDITTNWTSKNFNFGDATLLKSSDFIHITGAQANVNINVTIKADHGVQSSLIGFGMLGEGLFILDTSLLDIDKLGSPSINTFQSPINRVEGRGMLLQVTETGAIDHSISGLGFEYEPLGREKRYPI